MKKFRFIRHDEKAMELPINIVVMLVVGMVALATLISIMPTPTKDMSVFVESTALNGGNSVKGNSIIVSASTAENPFAVTAVVKITDSDGNPVRNANVILRGLGGAASNTTDANGVTFLTTPENARVRLDPNQNEGTMDLNIVADGFYDYEKKDAVMIIKTR
ncbi:Ig-like domain-containing protein [Methanosarcina sp.]|uniref:Ig-like domain-containing protein n=1 Tax=Methanosarcina sp. TaxID=2213 RepID=UPI0029889AF1|nr:Ig-like domain-containing protein [Methanosarcina sp.]MDW5551976.1 Ig-like domain-containing protein [Methanosarcina sp.]MDW5555738.1 Ig-like domain-containing protein [Methanosarcina sp.]MDW5561314.1 Ig-like domain-containing protein [Methanosarcina sp.]